ncbi:MAG: DUF362 domain-containing protein [Chloroflexi bacterium]|nr:DUF362 domain-containing protein [Chloroflexota bacterium]
MSRRAFVAAGLTLTGLALFDLSCQGEEGPQTQQPKLPSTSGTQQAVQPAPATPQATEAPQAAPSPPTTSTIAQPVPTTRPSATAAPTVSDTVVGLARQDGVAEMVTRAVELSGGLGFIKPDSVILVKPNVNSGLAHPATTNPAVVAAVIAMLQERKPKRIILADSSYPGAGANPDTLGNMRSSGIYDAALRAGAEVSDFSERAWKRVQPAGALHWGEGLEVPAMLDEIDHLISLPVVKTHFIASYSMALKITVGLLHSRTRRLLHSHGEPTFGSMVAEANLVRPADLVVLDGTKAFVSGGPDTGQEAAPNLIIATRNLVAADAVGLSLLKHLGSTPEVQNRAISEQSQILRAVELGLGGPDLSRLQLVSDGVQEIDSLRELLGA